MEIFNIKKTNYGSEYLSFDENNNFFDGEMNIKTFFSLRQTEITNMFLADLKLDKCKVLSMQQVHGNNVFYLINGENNFKSINSDNAKIFVDNLNCGLGDALITNMPNVLLTTIHADCLPIYFFDEKEKMIALAHSGWKGTSLEISRKVVEKMLNFGCEKENIKVWIGPGISKCCFEVRDDVIKIFSDLYGKSFIDSVSTKFLDKAETKYLIDLKKICHHQLFLAGITNVFTSNYCTACNIDKFYSYRKEGGIKERMIAGIALLK